jgi:cytochrome c5
MLPRRRIRLLTSCGVIANRVPKTKAESAASSGKKSRRRCTKSDAGAPMPEPDAGTAGPGETDAGMPPVEADAGVTPPPPPPSNVTCTSFGYSAWGVCQANGMQTRTVSSSAPDGCVGGTPVVSQACQYTPPLDGTALYAQYCANCHGNSQKGASASATKNAINANRGNMGKLSGLTAAQRTT